MTYIVLLDSGPGRRHAYGPIEDPEHARGFAEFMTREVDPAEPLKLIDPIDEMLANYRNRQPEERPIGWPPRPGEIWQDKNGDRWACCRVPNHGDVSYLICLAKQADDSAEEIWRQYGPMTRVQFVAPTLDEEPPF